MIDAMSRFARRLGFAGFVALVAACGGQSFTTVAGDGGPSDATSVVTGDRDILGDGPDAVASDAVSQADASDDGPPDSAFGGDGATDAGPRDAFVPDVIEEPPPHCNGAFECVPSVPPGWSGPFELYSGSVSSPPPPCSTNFAGPAYGGSGGTLTASAASCKCGCEAATGVGCSVPSISFYGEVVLGSGTCSTATHCTDVTLTPGVCTELDALSMCPTLKPTSAEMTVPGSAVNAGMCPPAVSQAIPPYSWSLTARACVSSLAPAQLDCGAGSVCAPQTASPFGSSQCISQPAAVACPTTGYTVGTTFYGGVNDGRTCTSCTCGAVTGASCSATVVVSSATDGTCTSNTVTYEAPVTCAGAQQPADFQLNLVASGGGCVPSPVAPTGAATPSSPTTFCCLP